MTSPRGAHLEREQLIESHLPLVRSVARRYAGRGESFDDLVQVGSVGLLKASNRFEESRGVAFATFAAPTIEGEIRRHLRDRTSPVRVPRELQRTGGELGRQRSVLAAALGHSPSVGELAAALETDPQQVERALEAELARNPVPLAPEADVAASFEDPAQQGSEERLSVAAGMRMLEERERAIVFLRFHADMTEKDIAAELGLSQAHVSRLLSSALAQLRSALAETDEQAVDGGNNEAMAVSHATSSKLRKAHSDERRRSSGAAGESAGGSEIAAQSGRDSKPRTTASHSGRFLVRMPGALHAQLARAAEREQVSLNRYVTDVLAASVARAPADKRARGLHVALAANLVVVILAAVAAIVLLVLALQSGI